MLSGLVPIKVGGFLSVAQGIIDIITNFFLSLMSTQWEAPDFVPSQITVPCGRGNTKVTVQPVEGDEATWQVAYSNEIGSMYFGSKQIGTMGGPYKPQREIRLTGDTVSLRKELSGCNACLPKVQKGCCFSG